MTPLVYRIILAMLAARAFAQDVIVETDVGIIIGAVGSAHLNGTEYLINEFLGIPYAEPPVAERRFAKPVEKAAFSQPFIAQKPPLFCPQNRAYLNFFGISLSPDVQSEDCLRLNIFTPENSPVGDEKRAVIVWIHGGFFEVETQNWYLAKLLVATQNVIYVTVNYRLSVLGFLSTGNNTLPGNNGLWDQHLAIQWVKNNIENFGGDPENITIAGESAGSAAVIHHALYAGSEELFKRVIAQSGSAMLVFENNPLMKFQFFADKTGCAGETFDETILCLQNKPLASLMDQLTIELYFAPVVDNDFIIVHPSEVFQNKKGKSSEILSMYRTYDIIFGLNSDEGALYLGSMDALVAEPSGDPVAGYTKDAFKDKIIPFVLETTKYPDTPILRKAIVKKYMRGVDANDQELIRQRSVDLMSDPLFNAGVIQSAIAHACSKSNGHTYLYVFDHKSLISFPGIQGASHAEEVIFALGFPLDQLLYFYGIDLTDPAELFTQNDLKLSLDMMQYWGNFAKTGNPNIGTQGPSSLTTWPEYKCVSQRYIRFRGGLDGYPIGSHYIALRMFFWNKLVPLIYKFCGTDPGVQNCLGDKKFFWQMIQQ